MSRHDSITIRGNEWYRHSVERGGYPVSFCMEFLGLNYQDTMSLLLDGDTPIVKYEKPPPEPKEFKLPKPNHTMHRVYAYLNKTRGILPDVITEFVHQRKIYEDKQYHNIVFVGKDDDGNPAWAGKRSTNNFGKVYRGNVEGSNKDYSFNHAGGGANLFVFESPIDLMSYITMYPTDWKNQNYISLDGVAARPLLHFLSNKTSLDKNLAGQCTHGTQGEKHHAVAQDFVETKSYSMQNSHIKTVYLCLDNDIAGREATERITPLLTERGFNVEVLMPELKDWNAELLSLITQNSMEQEVITL